MNYARADEALVDKVKGVLSDRGSVTFDDRTNTIIVRDVPIGIVEATGLIRELDIQSPQVLIEANIVEATEDFGRALGVQWGYGYKAGPATGNPTGLNFPDRGIGGCRWEADGAPGLCRRRPSRCVHGDSRSLPRVPPAGTARSRPGPRRSTGALAQRALDRSGGPARVK